MQHTSPFKYFLLSLSFICFGRYVTGQTKYQNIEVFSKVWGFLKYHHPAVALGNMDWDSLFITHIEKAAEAKNITQLNYQVAAIIDAAGFARKIIPSDQQAGLFILNHDLNWLYQSKFINKENKERLQFIYDNHNQGENRFIKFNNYSDYSGENQYETMRWPAAEYRLLFLSRFWNAINYFAPYKYLIGNNWNNILVKYIPKFINAKDTITYCQTLLKLAVSLNDGHSQLTVSGETVPVNNLVFGKYTAPVYVAVINETVIVTRPANDSLCSIAGIKKGDIISGINNEPVAQRMVRLKKYVSASNSNARNKYLAWILLNTHENYQKLTIKRGNKTFTVNVKCILAAERNWSDLTNYTFNNTGYKTIGNSIAYVYAMQVWRGNMDTIKALIKSKKAVIFDVRNYPNNGDEFYNIFDILLPQPKTINLSLLMMPGNPGYFKWSPSPMIGNNNEMCYKGKVIVLVDERTQSQGEYTAMAFQTIPNSVTIGSQTAGADGVVSPIPMGGKLAISYSGYGIYYPDKTQTQRVGVKIDIPVKKTVESIVNDRDLILEKALKYLKSKGID